jgi:hypothetical protein
MTLVRTPAPRETVVLKAPPRRDPAAAALRALIDATAIDPALDPTLVHRALVTAILRLVLFRDLGIPAIDRWPALLAHSDDLFARHRSPLFAPDPLLADLAVPAATLAHCQQLLASTTPGDVHQSLLSLRLERSADHRLHIRPGSERRRRGGHYTDTSLARDLIHHALRPQLDDLGPDPSAAPILALRVCDPAMGCAAFLIAACDILAQHLARARRDPDLAAARRDVAVTCLHGVDLDPLAVELARLALWRHIDDPGLPLAALDKNLRHGDALVGQGPTDLPAERPTRYPPPTSASPPTPRSPPTSPPPAPPSASRPATASTPTSPASPTPPPAANYAHYARPYTLAPPSYTHSTGPSNSPRSSPATTPASTSSSATRPSFGATASAAPSARV